MLLKAEAACGCHIGKRRAVNQDNFYFEKQSLPKGSDSLSRVLSREKSLYADLFYGIFDGMGGEKYGEEASLAAVNLLQEEKFAALDRLLSPREYLHDFILDMNDAVLERAEELKVTRMGSTAAMLYLNQRNVYVCNLGDSRIFRYRNHKLLQISKDHTDAHFLKESGIQKRKPSLTQHLGIHPDEMSIEPYIAKGIVKAEDQYLICSDGLTDMVKEEEIAALLEQTEHAKDCVEALIDRALAQGGKDNITVIVIKIS